ncbi:Ig-like domain-containing protein [Peribacillus sp. FSL E2-0218]|uniref:Ig-like domain-containing protein n=1 Tax=Peribacillus sp. FSL E2-0218 TaxID=2921364 RepID=UPI0030EDE523
MYKYLTILVFTALFILGFRVEDIVKASEGTSVKGIIKENATWTKENSPYYLTGDIQIANGIKLNVEPGVIIKGNNNRIRVFGDFEAIGKSESKIIFKNVNIEPGSGSSSEQFLIDIESAEIIQGSLYRPTGYGVYGSFVLKDSKLVDLTQDSFYLWYPTRDVYIERNVFVNSGGISVGTSDGVKVNIINNVFYNYTNYAIENWASYDNSETIVSHNSFLIPKLNDLGDPITSKDTLVLPAGYTNAKMIATNNYWGTTDESFIDNMVFDKNDDLSSSSYINFKPYLKNPDPNTPEFENTPPEHPIVDRITNRDTFIQGEGEKNATINVYTEYNYFVGNTKIDSNGKFKMPIQPIKEGTQLVIIATDEWFNKSNPSLVIVEDVISPNIPTVNEVTDKSTSMTGSAEAGSSITIKAGTTVIGSGTSNTEGEYKVTIPKQKAGTKLLVTATDDEGNSSEVKEVTVKDVTAPDSPTVNEVTENSTSVTGTAEAGSTITVKAGTTVIGSTTVDTEGKYTVSIPKQKSGTILSVTATDGVGNTSEVKEVTVKDVTAPRSPAIIEVTENSTSVSGTAEAGTTITVKAGTTVIGTVPVDTEGKYTVTIPKQKAGTKLTVTATDVAGNISEVKEVTVKDVTAPSVPTVNTVYDDATVISGKVETNAKVYALAGSKKIGEATAKNGAYTIKIAKQKAGSNISVYATDTSGNKSGSKTVKVIDKTPPSPPTANTVYDNATVISGKAETNAKVYAMVGSKKIGEATAKNGAYTIKIAKQKAGTSISVYAVDSVDNKSGSKTVKVIDKTAPSVPSVNKILSNTVSVTGKSEKGASIYIYNGSKKLGQGIVDSRGYYKVKIKAQKKDSTIKIYAQDKSGNQSDAKKMKVS